MSGRFLYRTTYYTRRRRPPSHPAREANKTIRWLQHGCIAWRSRWNSNRMAACVEEIRTQRGAAARSSTRDCARASCGVCCLTNNRDETSRERQMVPFFPSFSSLLYHPWFFQTKQADLDSCLHGFSGLCSAPPSRLFNP